MTSVHFMTQVTIKLPICAQFTIYLVVSLSFRFILLIVIIFMPKAKFRNLLVCNNSGDSSTGTTKRARKLIPLIIEINMHTQLIQASEQ